MDATGKASAVLVAKELLMMEEADDEAVRDAIGELTNNHGQLTDALEKKIDAMVGEFRQSGTGVLTLRSLADFDLPYDAAHAGDDVRRRDAFLALHAAASGSTQPFLRAVADTGTATLLSSEKYPLVAQAGAAGGIGTLVSRH